MISGVDSKEIYRVLVDALADDLKSKGYQRVAHTTFPAWTKPVNKKFATIWMQAARPSGEARQSFRHGARGQAAKQSNQFTVELQYSEKPEPGTGKWNERKRFFALLDDAERLEVTRKFPAGAMTANEDFWFLAKDREAVLAVAEWASGKIEELTRHIGAEAET